ncbi:MAG: hypothetical protein HQL56_09440 [Magnetococcales bacterium]|nr:hypothetical protein [Magnetococcales bacterium]
MSTSEPPTTRPDYFSDRRDMEACHKPAELEFRAFPEEDPLVLLRPRTRELEYIQCYLKKLNVTSLLVEPNYVDWEFLSQHAAYYSSSMLGITNLCRRLHFFSGEPLTREMLTQALSGDKNAQKRLQDRYQGFMVLRPIPNAPLGRTVLRWTDDKSSRNTPRITACSRPYKVHIAGLPLTVVGLSWQQQDQATGACATIALWIAQQASPYRHFSSTTPEITQDAHRFYASGNRTFPSNRLTQANIVEAIRAIRGLDACVIEGDIGYPNNRFSQYRFCCYASMFLAGGFPVLLYGEFPGNKLDHVNLLIGYRSVVPSHFDSDAHPPNLQEAQLKTVFIHDDGIGPNISFAINNKKDNGHSNKRYVTLSYLGVGDVSHDITTGQEACPETSAWASQLGEFIPTAMIVMVPKGLRSDPFALLNRSVVCYMALTIWNEKDYNKRHATNICLDFSFSLNIVSVVDYFQEKLENVLGSNAELLAKTRLALLEKVPPMSRYLAVARFSVRTPEDENHGPFLDILHDTTESALTHPVIAIIQYQEEAEQAVDSIAQNAEVFMNDIKELLINCATSPLPPFAGKEFILSPRTVRISAILKTRSRNSPAATDE